MSQKVTNNVPYQPGEGITAPLLNDLAQSAQTGRLMSGDGSANVQMIGNTIGIGANLPFKNLDKEILAILRAPLSSPSKTPALGGGMYYGSTFNQGLILQNTMATKLTIVRPVPTLYNCIILNGSENLGTGHAINVDTPCIARFMGYSAPNAKGVSFPLLFTRVEPITTRWVLVKQNAGSDGTSSTYATWTYDLYDIKDVSLATKLNVAGALQPLASAARVAFGSVTEASNGSIALAFYGADGTIMLWNVQEKAVSNVCSSSTSDAGLTPSFMGM